MDSVEREPDAVVKQRGPPIESEADFSSSLVLLETILMNGSEEANVVSTECGERRRECSEGKGAVPHWPETRIKYQNSQLPLAIEVTLGR